MTRIVLRGGRIFDGTGSAPADGDISIEDGVIAGLGSGLDGDEAVDVAGCTVLPGFIDCHIHALLSSLDTIQNLNMPFSLQFYLAAENLRKTLDAGITTVRDASGADLGVQRAVELGLIDGPDLHISIIALSQTGGHGDHWLPSGNHADIIGVTPGRPSGIVDGVDECRRKVRELLRNGANMIKVNTSGGVFSPRDDPSHAHFTMAELTTMVEEAERAGSYVMAHAHGAAGIKNAVRAGIRSIEHGTELDDEAIELMLANGTWLVPTLGVGRFILERIEQGAAVPPAVAEKAIENQRLRADSFRRAVEAGVRIAMGSDAAAESHGRNLGELALMHEQGLDAAATLRAGTQSAAQLMRIDERVGTLRPGLRADLVVVEGDPYDFRAYPGNLRAVFKAGRQVRGLVSSSATL
ncbi:amidohydrolase family protein [Dactylosporangium sp. CA-092794]|uniref:metal-dependent hydrolase family protein n=1 Tax=Dactylosporangium sp. CA-092794 TaxID=3239929 RepID=UPI003D90760F